MAQRCPENGTNDTLATERGKSSRIEQLGDRKIYHRVMIPQYTPATHEPENISLFSKNHLHYLRSFEDIVLKEDGVWLTRHLLDNVAEYDVTRIAVTPFFTWDEVQGYVTKLIDDFDRAHGLFFEI